MRCRIGLVAGLAVAALNALVPASAQEAAPKAGEEDALILVFAPHDLRRYRPHGFEFKAKSGQWVRFPPHGVTMDLYCQDLVLFLPRARLDEIRRHLDELPFKWRVFSEEGRKFYEQARKEMLVRFQACTKF